MRKPKISIQTWGCKVNTYDSGLLESRFKTRGFDMVSEAELKSSLDLNRDSQPLVFVLNSCAVTREATDEVLRKARKLKESHPEAKVVFTGCAAQVDGAIVDSAPGLDLIVANSHKGQIEDSIERLVGLTAEPAPSAPLERVQRSNIFLKTDSEEGGGLESSHTRAFLKVQDGCNSFCTYCVIPFARGRSRSIPIAALVNRANQLFQAGARELVITGVHIADYCDETKPLGSGQLHHLVRALCVETDFRRIRLSSLEPGELTEDLMQVLVDFGPGSQDERICPSFHLSIQSLSAKVLKLMRRQYSVEKAMWALKQLETTFDRPYVAMDLIVGFPGEGDPEFDETLTHLMNSHWTKIHVFPYSERPMTKAVHLPESVPVAIRRERSRQIRELSQSRMQNEARRLIGAEVEALRVQSRKTDVSEFVARNLWKIKVPGSHSSSIGAVARVRVQNLGLSRSHDVWLHGEALV